MSDLEQIAILANNFLQSSNNQLRAEAENQLKLLRDSKPNELVVLFLGLLESKNSSTTLRGCYCLALWR